MNWLVSLPWYYRIEVNGKPFLLVHAGIDPERMEDNEKRDAPGYILDYCEVELPDGFGRQDAEDLVWIREEWLSYSGKLPYTVIHGHSEFAEASKVISPADDATFSGELGRIYRHHSNRIGIDCGVSHGCAPHALGCLRLDDFKEFYVELGEE